MSTYALFAGGGVRVNYATGCICRLTQMNSPLLADLNVVSGVSAGAILACAIATKLDIPTTYNTFATTQFVEPPNACTTLSRAVSMYTGHRDAFFNNEVLQATMHKLIDGARVSNARIAKVYAHNTRTQTQHAFPFMQGSKIQIMPVVASCSIPGVFPPVNINGVKFVDGGVQNSFGMSDIKSGISDPSVRTMLLFATSPWMGRRSTNEQTPSGRFKHVLNTSLHGLMELDHWHVMDMMDIEHDDVPNGRFMALYKRHKGDIELLQVLQPGHKRNVHYDLAVLFFAPTPEEYVSAEQVSLKDAPKLRKPSTDHMFSKGKQAAGEMNLLANQVGLAWKRKLEFY